MEKTDLIPAKVALRVRPLPSKELPSGCQSVISYAKKHQIILCDEKIYDFDYVFNHESGQSDVYDSCASALVDKVFAGFDITIFAYGQTGSGKTYTMGTNYKKHSSCKESYGIIPRLLEDVFRAKESSTVSKIQVSFTFVEIYNEVLYDLMTSKTQQPKGLRELSSAVKPGGIKEIKLNNCEEALQLFEEGCNRRVQEKTVGNRFSSRSHAIFTLNITNYNKKGDAVTAKLNLVDLAGSEACSKNLNSNSRYKEGININLSLLTLGKVIRALRDTSNISQSAHIPYRDSLLTRLLKDSLSSNCLILMIACVNPARYCLAETLSTLSYAATVCRIKTRPVIKTSTAKKTSRNPLQVLPPTPAWVKQGFNITIATPSMHSAAVKNPHPYRQTVGTFQREVQDSSCSPIFKEPFGSVLPVSTPYQASNSLMYQNSNNTVQKLEFSTTAKTVQKTLKDYFTPRIRYIDKENLPQKKNQKDVCVLSTKKDLSVLAPSSLSFLSPVPVHNFTFLTPLKDRTNMGDSPALNTRSHGKKYSFANLEDLTGISGSPALNTRSCWKKRSFADIEEASDVSSSTLGKHSASKKLSPSVPETEEQYFCSSSIVNRSHGKNSNQIACDLTGISGSPALNTRSCWKKRSFADIEEAFDVSSSTLGKHSASKKLSPSVPETEDGISTPGVDINEEKTEAQHSLPSAKIVMPIPLPDLDDEIFDLPPPAPATPKYCLRKRLTQHCYTIDYGLWRPEKKQKARNTEVLPKRQTVRRKTKRKTEIVNPSFLAFPSCGFNTELQQPEKKQKRRKTEVLHKSQAARKGTRGRKSEIINGSTKAKLIDMELIQQESHESEVLRLLNAGTLKDLQQLPAVGPKTAYIIFTWRKLKGPFGKIKDLRQVVGLSTSFFTRFSKTNLISV